LKDISEKQHNILSLTQHINCNFITAKVHHASLTNHLTNKKKHKNKKKTFSLSHFWHNETAFSMDRTNTYISGCFARIIHDQCSAGISLHTYSKCVCLPKMSKKYILIFKYLLGMGN